MIFDGTRGKGSFLVSDNCWHLQWIPRTARSQAQPQVYNTTLCLLNLRPCLNGPAIRNANRRPPDYSSNLSPPKTFAIWLFWGDSRESIRRNPFAEGKKKKPIFIIFGRFTRIVSNLRFATFLVPRDTICKKSRAAKRGGFKRGGFPIWTCPSFFVLFCPFWDFPDFSGIFPICSGMVRGFSRLVLLLFLGLLRAPTRNSPESVRDTIWTFPEKSGKPPGLETPRFSFSHKKKGVRWDDSRESGHLSIHVLCSGFVMSGENQMQHVGFYLEASCFQLSFLAHKRFWTIFLKFVCPLQRSKIPKIRKRGSRVEKPPLSPHPRKGYFESKQSPCLHIVKMGIFWLETPLSGEGRSGGLSNPEPPFPDFGDFDPSGKSTLWTNTGQDWNFQRTLSAIGPYEFRGKFIWTPIIGPYLFLGKFVWTNGPESSSKVSPYTGIGQWMALPSPCKRQTDSQSTFACNWIFSCNWWESASEHLTLRLAPPYTGVPRPSDPKTPQKVSSQTWVGVPQMGF